MDRLDELRAQLALVTHIRSAVAVLGIVLTVACSDGQPETALPRQLLSAPPGRVDSVLPVHEAVRRFVDGLPVVAELEGGAPGRDSLVAAFMAAVSTQDRAALGTLIVTQAEYGHLYYPSSAYSSKPYELPPDIAWMLNRQNSAKAINRVLQRLGGHSIQLVGYECSDSVKESANQVWRNCRVSYRQASDAPVVTRQLFGSILERNGAFKFLSYASDF